MNPLSHRTFASKDEKLRNTTFWSGILTCLFNLSMFYRLATASKMSSTKRLTLSYNLQGDHDFLVKRRDLSDYNQYIENKKKLGFKDCKNVLSIGCGDGYIDSFLAGSCMSSLKSYTGIYPVAGHCQLFLERMKDKLPDINVSVVCDDPVGVSTSVMNSNELLRPDLIVVWHFMYHITNVERLFTTYLRLLQDGGQVVVTLAKPGCFWSQILDEVHGSTTYNSDTFVADLLRMGVKKKDIAGKVTLFEVKEYYDATKPTKETYDSILEREATDRDIKIIDKVFNKNAKDGVLTQDIVTFVLPKNIFPKSLYTNVKRVSDFL